MSKIPDFPSLAPPATADSPVPSASTSSTSSSSLASAFIEPAQRPRRPPRTEPPSWYNPYPYARSWTLERRVTQQELWSWHHREDDWPRVDSGGAWLLDIKHAVWSVYTNGVRARQHAACREWEEARLLENQPMTPKRKGDGVSHGRDVRFQTFDWEEGIPVKALISGRRALQHFLRDANTEPFKGLGYDTIRVRMKWPAYPDYEPDRQIVITARKGRGKVKRRPITRMEFLVSLGSFFTQYYAEVSKMEPHPAFAHLALGPGESKISLYALRLMGIHAGTGGCFDLDLELDTVEPKASSDDEPEADGDAMLASPAPASDVSVASTSTSTPGPSTTSESDPDPDDDGAKTPPWASTLPVTCTVAPPPQIPHQNYFNHVDPLTMQAHALPAWPDVYGRR
ncbi:hypothetical protein LXA43DRAFT_903615 [Ganoderma leucocontextum]|nr:hypothetical protein LXA43DRAFT_903615 [Ganoderma leucocontextum]